MTLRKCLKFPDLTDIINFRSDKDLTRFEFFKRSLLIIFLVIVASFIYSLKYAQRDTSPSALIAFDIIICIGLLAWTLTSRIVTQIQLDLYRKKFIVHFMTAVSDNKTLEIQLKNLSFKFTKEPTKHHPKKWTLRVFNDNEKAFSIDTNQDGFSQETLEDLVKQLQNIKHLLS